MNSLNDNQYIEDPGPFEARYLAFLETISTLRPSLHRYCARMTGSVMDGEDVVQEALLEAYRKLDKFDDSRPLKPWLFRIAHNRCIDFLRRKGVRAQAESAATAPEAVLPVEPATLGIGEAVEHLVLTLPPKERVCVLLKDVFDYSLEEIAELVDSTVGGVKAALKRGRSKLAALPEHAAPPRKRDESETRLLRLYIERFNRRDWDGVRELISADARLAVADRFLGPMSESPYFGNYEDLRVEWRMALGEVDGEPVIVRLDREQDHWKPRSFVRLSVKNGQIIGIVDYWHCPWVLPAAASIVVDQSLPN